MSEEVSIRRVGRPGDLGWIVQANAEVYAEQFGWDASYEALVCRIVADFTEADPARSAGWIAELAGQRVGTVVCVPDTAPDTAPDTGPDTGPDTARLRILLVTPEARGRHIGSRLVQECLDFARAAGYTRMTLWTNDVLTSARRIYVAAGFTLIDEEPHHSFGVDLVGQHWSREL